jgi:CheY-like chemotaxis protein
MSFSGIFSSPMHQKVVLFIAAHEDALAEYHTLAGSGGFEAELARDGYEGLLLANLARPDLVVLDLRHPELDGLWILRRLRSGVGTRAVPVILVGASSEALVEAAHDGEGQRYVVDAQDSLRLLHIVRGLLGGPSHPAGAASAS